MLLSHARPRRRSPAFRDWRAELLARPLKGCGDHTFADVLREARVLAYQQYLQSYKSVTTANMAAAFAVSEAFLDAELSNFIVEGRLNVKIDKVNGVLVTNRPDAKNALYRSYIKEGDNLLNRIQKLSRVVDL